jgi:hypothetical protein
MKSYITKTNSGQGSDETSNITSENSIDVSKIRSGILYIVWLHSLPLGLISGAICATWDREVANKLVALASSKAKSRGEDLEFFFTVGSEYGRLDEELTLPTRLEKKDKEFICNSVQDWNNKHELALIKAIGLIQLSRDARNTLG